MLSWLAWVLETARPRVDIVRFWYKDSIFDGKGTYDEIYIVEISSQYASFFRSMNSSMSAMFLLLI